jgi:hypothetical protein
MPGSVAFLAVFAILTTGICPRQCTTPGETLRAYSTLDKSFANGRSAMTYRVYSGPRGSQSISPLEKDRHLFKEFGLLDEAMNWARHVNDSGRVTLLIEGDDGTRLDKQQVVSALKTFDAAERDQAV